MTGKSVILFIMFQTVGMQHPNTKKKRKIPLLIVLHGLTQTKKGNGIMNITGFNEIAEDNNFVVCYP